MPETDPLTPEIIEHYKSGYEQNRLDTGFGQLEFIRTQEILKRFLPQPPAIILDVTGGTGTYALWLSKERYEVHFTDIVPLHVELARQASLQQPDTPFATIEVGDARKLNFSNEFADSILLFGLMYHLISREDRIAALREVRRVLRKNGCIFISAISRYASTFEGLRRGFFKDPEFVKIAQRDRTDGQHRNPGNHPNYFMTTFFHHPNELQKEIKEAGLTHLKTLAVEGIASCSIHNFNELWNDPDCRERMLQAIKSLEEEPSLLGISDHLIAIASND